MNNRTKAELASSALFLLYDIVKKYAGEGYYSSETVEESRKKLEELTEELENQKRLDEK